MRITRRQLTQIIKEELLREVEATQGTTDVGVPPERDPLIKALKLATEVGHQGAVFTTTASGDVALMRAIGDGRNFEAADAVEYESFLDTYIKPGKRAAYDAKFKKLNDGSTGPPKTLHVPVADVNDGLASDYLLMGITLRGDDDEIKKLHDYRRYSVEETYRFLKNYVTNTPIKVYDYIDGKDTEGEGRLIYPAPEAEKAAAQTRNSADDTWAANAAKSPLRSGATGPNVKKAQDLLVKELKKMSSTAMAPVGPALIALQNLLAQKKIEGNKDNPAALTKSLAEKIEASGPDGKFGPMTKVAVQVFQQQARLDPVDGVIGKDTANALILGTEKVSLLNQAEQVPATPPTAADVEDVNESYIINRWNKLAGLLVD